MFALKNQYETTYFRPNSPLSLGCAVAFTDSEFSTDTIPTQPAWIIEKPVAQDPDKLGKSLVDYVDKLSAKRMKRLLGNNREKWQEALKTMNDLQLELEQTVRITSRPETIFRSDLETLRPQLLRLTNDQLNSLKRVRLNNRCVINGAAGTGKTVLAMELARERCEKGESVALLCSNPNLSRRFER